MLQLLLLDELTVGDAARGLALGVVAERRVDEGDTFDVKVGGRRADSSAACRERLSSLWQHDTTVDNVYAHSCMDSLTQLHKVPLSAVLGVLHSAIAKPFMRNEVFTSD